MTNNMPPLSPNDVLRFTARSTYLGQESDNVFFYLVEAVTATIDLTEAALDFFTAWTNVAKVLQRPAVSHYGVDVSNLTDPARVAYRPSTATSGTAAGGDDTPSFLAYGLSLLGSSSITRQGGKRLCGIPEGYVNGNSLTGVPTAEVANLLNFLKQDFTTTSTAGSASATLQPIILGRLTTGEYDFSRINPITGATLSPEVTKQGSRQKGRGI